MRPLRFLGEARNRQAALDRNMFDQNDHLVLNNAGFRVENNAAQIVSGWLRGKGSYLVFILVYSPEFNAAGLVFSYLKTMLKGHSSLCDFSCVHVRDQRYRRRFTLKRRPTMLVLIIDDYAKDDGPGAV